MSSEEVLSRSPAVCQPPSDCSWQRTDEFGTIVFTQRGRFSVAAFFGLLFINAFWNGIVSVFVGVLWFGDDNGKLAGLEWWGLFVFLIPFEVIGLCMFLGLVAAILEPLRRTSWRFGDSLMECRVKWLGLGPIWRYQVDELARMDLAPANKAKKGRQGGFPIFGSATGGDRRLLFVDKANAEICAIPRLTEGEARWISSTVEQQRPGWFR